MKLSLLVVTQAAIMLRLGAAPAVKPHASHIADAAATCRSIDDAAEAFRAFIAPIVTGSDRQSQAQRSAFALLAAPDTAIRFVTDDSTCHIAARLHASRAGDDTVSPPPVHVLRAGPSRFIVFNFHRTGEWLDYLVFDDQFRYLTTIGS